MTDLRIKIFVIWSGVSVAPQNFRDFSLYGILSIFVNLVYGTAKLEK